MTEREILEKTIKDSRAVLEDAEAKIKELDSPKLRHGDYGHDSVGRPTIHLDPPNANWPDSDSCRPLSVFGKSWNYADHYGQEVKVVLGNIFDDLKRNSEDLEKYNTQDDRGDGLRVDIVDRVAVRLNNDASVNRLDPSDAIEYAQRIIQIAHTIKRKQNN